MITRTIRAQAPLALAAIALFVSACDKVPLLAPSGSTITLTSQATSLSANGTTTIVAQVIEPSGTPPHAGTLVSFSTNLGRLQPADAETDISGRATATFFANGASGTATITAISGGVSPGLTGNVRIAVGNAAVGSIILSASPLSLPASGGSSVISATVNDNGGNTLAGIPVTFTTDAGSVTLGVVTTDSSGFARTTLTTGRTAKVTATAGVATTSDTTTTAAPSNTVTVTVNTAPSIVFGTFAPSPATAGGPVSTVLTITPATGAAIRNVSVNWGDGSNQTLGTVSGAIPLAHTYGAAGTYTVVATVTDSNGDTSQGIAQVSVLKKPIAQISLAATPTTAAPNAPITFIVTIDSTLPAGVTVDRYEWNFGGDGSAPRTTTSKTTTHAYNGVGTYTVTVQVIFSDGTTAITQSEVRVQ